MIQLRVIPADARPDPLFVRTAAEASFGAGFYDEEHDGAAGVFRWMGERAVIDFAPDPEPRFLEYWACSEFYDLSQRLAFSSGGAPIEDLPLRRGWAPGSVVIPDGASRLELQASKLFPREHYPGDGRTLALRLRGLLLHKDPERHAAVRRQQDNALANARELLDGRTALESTPPSLGIDLYGTCNVKPPCVYCEWDHAKHLEGDHVDTPFTRDTLREWGAFFDNAVSLVNCSIGEPFMMKPIDDLLDAFGDNGKVLEMTTNGQILTERNIQKLLGRPIDLYVSLDAATALTYARLRNDTFEKILSNLRRLIEAKGGPEKLPRIHLVFMPMRCNVHELDAFVRLCADLRVDRMVLRPLNYSPSVTLATDRGGYHYDYQQELLPFDELVKVSAKAARLAQQLGVNLSDQMDFGGAMRELFQEAYDAPTEAPTEAAPTPAAAGPEPPPAAVVVAPAAELPAASPALPSLGGERLPACTEPWKSLYILRRGVMPCCYGGEPLAAMETYRETWNSPEVQAIRASLLQGQFHDYCLRSPACPIVRKSNEAGILPLRQRALLRARLAWAVMNRHSLSVPDRLRTLVRRGLHAGHMAVTDPRRFARRLGDVTRGR